MRQTWDSFVRGYDTSRRVAKFKAVNAELLEALERIIKADHPLGHGLTCQFCIDKAKRAIDRATRATDAALKRL